MLPNKSVLNTIQQFGVFDTTSEVFPPSIETLDWYNWSRERYSVSIGWRQGMRREKLQYFTIRMPPHFAISTLPTVWRWDLTDKCSALSFLKEEASRHCSRAVFWHIWSFCICFLPLTIKSLKSKSNICWSLNRKELGIIYYINILINYGWLPIRASDFLDSYN